MQTCTQCGQPFQPARKNFRKTCSDRCLLRSKERTGTMNKGKPDPTPEEIAVGCAVIQSGWTPAEERSRAGENGQAEVEMRTVATVRRGGKTVFYEG